MGLVTMFFLSLESKASSVSAADYPALTLRQWYKGQLATNVYFGGAGMNDESKQAELERMANFIGRIADALITEDQSHG